MFFKKKKEKEYPHLIYFLVKHPKRNVTYDELYKEEFASTMKYYTEYGKDGFLSERIFLEDVKHIAERNAKNEFNKIQNCAYTIQHFVIHDKKIEQSQKSMIENRKDFIRWLK